VDIIPSMLDFSGTILYKFRSSEQIKLIPHVAAESFLLPDTFLSNSSKYITTVLDTYLNNRNRYSWHECVE